MLIKTKGELTNLKGEILKNNGVSLTIGEVLAEIVLAPHKDKNGFRPLKGLELAKKFIDQEEVEIDKADFIQLKEVVENNESYVPLVIAQVLLLLEDVKETEEKK